MGEAASGAVGESGTTGWAVEPCGGAGVDPCSREAFRVVGNAGRGSRHAAGAACETVAEAAANLRLGAGRRYSTSNPAKQNNCHSAVAV